MADSNLNGTLTDPSLLERIDKLFEAKIGDYVNLPQLVVVGDQSSGKSSVLEGLTGIPFPRDKALCTRFATQIMFRRHPKARVTVSIMPATDCSSEHKTKVRAWKKESTSFGKDHFIEIMKEVYDVMDIRQASSSAQSKTTFSSDMLKIEICGPEQQHLSVIDVPGIFRLKTQGVTTDQDKDMVRAMVKSYMRNPRSVILAIIPANVDIATQEITEMAKEFDPDCIRTLGVFTKPDLVDEGAEQAVLDVLTGVTHVLRRGWYVVLNPGQKALDANSSNRHDAEEEFFRTTDPWTRVPKERAGIMALRECLTEILGQMIDAEFPNVKDELTVRLNHCKRKRDELGPARDTRNDRYKLLLDLAGEFQRIADCAVTGKYQGANILRDPNMRLATLVVDRNHGLDEDMDRFGHKMDFDKGLDNAGVISDELRTYGVRDFEEKHELDDLFPDFLEVPAPQRTGIKSWIKATYKESRGFEMGTFDAALFPILWKEQSMNWDYLALGYISDVIRLVHDFISTVLSSICRDAKVEKAIRRILSEHLRKRYSKSIKEIQKLLDVERQGTPFTVNHYFADNLEKARQRRLEKMTQDKAFKLPDDGPEVIRVSDMAFQTHQSNLEHVVEDLHDILEAYYKVARKRFVDNVCLMATDRYLITGSNSPLKLFSPAFVHQLTDKQLEDIAAEGPFVKKKREDLNHDIEILENGRNILI